jgi:2-polyprenyl-6-methoxyphenol hydroxylase-like FAD-dependent oxidoreductase
MQRGTQTGVTSGFGNLSLVNVQIMPSDAYRRDVSLSSLKMIISDAISSQIVKIYVPSNRIIIHSLPHYSHLTSHTRYTMSPSQTEKPSQVLIIGGGLGGLALAQGLKKASVPFHIFEQDPSADFRPQGYRLKINGDGAAALKKVLSEELWTHFEETCAESKPGETNFNAISALVTNSRAGPGLRGGPTPYLADRTVLRNILRTGLEEHISYGKKFSSYTIEEEGITATFADGTTYEGVLLVGADGVRSGVRKQYQPEHKIIDTNGRCIYGKTPMSEELIQRFPSRATKWMTLIVDQTPMTQTLDIDETPLTLLLEPVRFQNNKHRKNLPDNYVYWVLIARSDLFGKPDSELLRLNAEDSAALSLKLTEEWDPSIRSIFELQDISQSSTLRVSSAKPEIPFWTSSERITLVGDAVHVMSPCGGVGAVTALRDASVLASKIAENGINTKSIGAYEAEMRVYAKMMIERSYFGGKKMFGHRPFGECALLEL